MKMAFDEARARGFAQNSLMAGEDLLRIGTPNLAVTGKYT